MLEKFAYNHCQNSSVSLPFIDECHLDLIVCLVKLINAFDSCVMYLLLEFQCLHLELNDILADPEILFPFMQFMKSEASVNVLQFYLSVGQHNLLFLSLRLTLPNHIWQNTLPANVRKLVFS